MRDHSRIQTSNNYIVSLIKKIKNREALITRENIANLIVHMIFLGTFGFVVGVIIFSPVVILGAMFVLIGWLPLLLFAAFSEDKYWWLNFGRSKNSSIGSKSKNDIENTPKSINTLSKSTNANNNANKYDDNSCCYQTRKTGRYYCHCGRAVVSRLPVKVTTY